jgi:UDP-glucose:glycoprotein glucosyltransferase
LTLSIRNAAPRIEAHYQYYKTAVEPSLKDGDCEAWMELGGKQYCDPKMDKEHSQLAGQRVEMLPFDRILGTESPSVSSVLYADITSPEFRKFHQTAARAAREGQGSYRVRYKPLSGGDRKPLVINGYGVELALKRTDYIVIDDRQKEESKEPEKKDTPSPEQTDLTDEEVADLKPLAASELENLGINAASFVTNSERPLDTLLKLTQDFPKHSASLVNRNATDEFIEEHTANRELFLQSGFNVMWINGVQVDPRKMDIYSLLDHLKRERTLINSFKGMGLTSAEAISLLSHTGIAEAHEDSDTQRYDWRDEIEDGKVILWLNDIEKDRRYKDWSSSVFGVSNPF